MNVASISVMKQYAPGEINLDLALPLKSARNVLKISVNTHIGNGISMNCLLKSTVSFTIYGEQ